MKITTDFLMHGDRYVFDFDRCHFSEGWAQFDTDSDASYYGHWINPLTLALVAYAEGDVTIWQAENAEEFTGQVRRWLDCLPGGRIDPMCCPRITAALIDMGLCDPAEAPRLEEVNAPCHYTLPDGWTWTRVATERKARSIPKRQFPLVSAAGAVAWGVPLAPPETTEAGA